MKRTRISVCYILRYIPAPTKTITATICTEEHVGIRQNYENQNAILSAKQHIHIHIIINIIIICTRHDTHDTLLYFVFW